MSENAPTSIRGPVSLRWLEVIGIALTLIALAWWAVVFGQVMSNTDFPVERTLPCLLQISDRCSLAMALCKNWHFLGIRRYSPELLWTGAIVCSLALLLGSRRQRSNSRNAGL